jgi:hypothetical protein
VLKDDGKQIIFLVLTILTFSLINLLCLWFPKLKFYLLYTITSLKNATHLGIECRDNQFYIINIYELDLPKLNSGNLQTNCKNSIHSFRTKGFQFKLFKYTYSPLKKAFLAIKFNINIKYEIIGRKFLTGLNETEVAFQQKIYGTSDIIVEIPTILTLLLKELNDPFYFFQFFSVILWINNNYIHYSLVIIISTIISIGIGIYEVRVNLLNIQKMARYNCDVIIHRNFVI